MKFQALPKYINEIYAVMRIVVGILFISHGIQKANAMLTGAMPTDNFLLLFAAVIETIAGLMIMIGWQTNWAAFISSGEMAVAYFTQHATRGFFPINNGGELAVFYCFTFLFMAAHGAGIWSLDNARKKKAAVKF